MKKLSVWPVGLTLTILLFIGIQVALVGIAAHAFEGPDDEQYYDDGLHYDRNLEAMERQRRLHWNLKAEVTHQAVLVVIDRNGAPVSQARVAATVGHPATRSFDQALQLVETSPGHYQAPCRLVSGVWDVSCTVHTADDAAHAVMRCKLP